MNTDRELTVAWVGGYVAASDTSVAVSDSAITQNELLERVQCECGRRGYSLKHLHMPWLDPAATSEQEAEFIACLAPADRVVVRWQTRVELPVRTINALQARTATAPWSVVTGSHIDGSRRTGLGAMPFPQLAWYRWWEAWYAWFFPELARASAITRAHFAPAASPVDWAWPQAVAQCMAVPGDGCLTIVSGCADTQAAWRAMAEHVGWSVHCLRSLDDSSLDAVLPPSAAQRPSCWLVDDSALGLFDRVGVELASTLRQWRTMDASRTLIVALGLEHLPRWHQLRHMGFDDFFVKPSFGLPLCELLTARFGSPADCSPPPAVASAQAPSAR